MANYSTYLTIAYLVTAAVLAWNLMAARRRSIVVVRRLRQDLQRRAARADARAEGGA